MIWLKYASSGTKIAGGHSVAFDSSERRTGVLVTYKNHLLFGREAAKIVRNGTIITRNAAKMQRQYEDVSTRRMTGVSRFVIGDMAKVRSERHKESRRTACPI